MKSLEERMERERERRTLVGRAIEAADRVILDGSDGSVEETDYLTSEVAHAFAEKVRGRICSVMLRKDLND